MVGFFFAINLSICSDIALTKLTKLTKPINRHKKGHYFLIMPQFTTDKTDET